MKNSRWKRVSALLLTAAMTVSVIPTGALAAEEASQSVTEAEDVFRKIRKHRIASSCRDWK